MNWFDITVAILLILAFMHGYRKGVIRQLIGLVGILIAVILGGKFARIISPHLDRAFDLSPQALHILSCVLAIIAIILAVTLIGQIVEKVVNIIFLGFLNRLLGGVIGIAATTIILSLVLNLLLPFDTEKRIINENIRTNSFFYERVQAVVPTIVPYLNKEMLNEYIPELFRDNTDEESDSEESSFYVI